MRIRCYPEVDWNIISADGRRQSEESTPKCDVKGRLRRLSRAIRLTSVADLQVRLIRTKLRYWECITHGRESVFFPPIKMVYFFRASRSEHAGVEQLAGIWQDGPKESFVFEIRVGPASDDDSLPPSSSMAVRMAAESRRVYGRSPVNWY